MATKDQDPYVGETPDATIILQKPRPEKELTVPPPVDDKAPLVLGDEPQEGDATVQLDAGDDVPIHLRSDRKATEATNLPADAPVPIFFKDDPELENLYKANEANSYLNDQLLEQDEITGEINSLVENVVPDGDFDPEKPVMPRSQLRTINTLESLIPAEEHQALIEAGTMGADFFDSTVNIIGGSLEDAAHNSLKYFYSLTPDSFQDAFKQTMFGQHGGIAGITGTEEQFEQTRMFPHMGGIIEEMARSIGSFAWGMKGSGILLQTKKAMVLRGAISDMTVFNPDHGNLAHVIREMDWGPEVLQNLARYIDSTEPGTATEKRARMAAEGILLTMAISGAMRSPQAMRELKEWSKTFFGENGTGRPAVDAVTKLLSEMKNKWNKKFNFGKYLDDHNPGWRSTGGGAPTEAESAARGGALFGSDLWDHFYKENNGEFWRGESTKGAGVGLGALGRGIYITDRKGMADFFARQHPSGVVNKYKVKPGLNFIDSFSPEVIKIKEEMGFKPWEYSDSPMYSNILTSRLKKLGYDGVVSDKPAEGIVIFDKKNVELIK